METCEIEYFGNFGEPDTVHINKGKRIDELVQDVFTEGQCHALALALHEKTKWPLYGLYGGWDEDKEQGETPGHVVVVSPNGAVDIMGLGVECRWSDRELVKLTKKEVMNFQNIDYLKPNLPVAREFVKPVLALVEKQNKKKVPTSCTR